MDLIQKHFKAFNTKEELDNYQGSRTPQDIQEINSIPAEMLVAWIKNTQGKDFYLKNTKRIGKQEKYFYLENANLKGVNLSRIDLRGANLRSANITETNLMWTNFRDADITNADITNTGYVI